MTIHDYVDQGLDAITPGHAPVSTGATLPPPRVRPWMVVAGAVGVLGLAAVARAAMERAVETVRGLPKFRETEENAEALEPEANRETMELFLDSLPEEERERLIEDIADGHPRSDEWSPEHQQMFADWIAQTNHPKATLYSLQYHQDPYLNSIRWPDSVQVDLYNKDLKVRHLGDDGAPLARAMLDAYGYDAGKILPGKLRLKEIEGGAMTGWSPPRPEDVRKWVIKGGKRKCSVGHSPACNRWFDSPRVRMVVREPFPRRRAGPTGARSQLVAGVLAYGGGSKASRARGGDGHKLPRKYTGPHSQCNLSEVYAIKGGARVPIDVGGLEAVEDAYDNPSVER